MRKYTMIIKSYNELEALRLLVSILTDDEVKEDVTVINNEYVNNGIQKFGNGNYQIVFTCNDAKTKTLIAKRHGLTNVYQNRTFEY